MGRSHINCLELMVAALAIQTVAKNRTGISVLLRIDNTTMVAYINNFGKTISRELIVLARNLWMWCLERNIHIITQHLPGVLNQIADYKSRTMIDCTDWQLNPAIFRQVNQLFNPLEVDLFASRFTTQLQVYFSWQSVHMPRQQMHWSFGEGYANPPWCLIVRVLSQVQTQRVQLVLIATVRKSQPWYLVVLKMLISHPQLILEDYLKGTDHEKEMLMP